MTGTDPLLEVRGLKKYFPVRRGFFRKRAHVAAVDGVDFALGAGETLSIVGESGCGKSTVGRLVLRLVDPTEGEVLLRGRRIDQLHPSALRPLRKDMQIVFQDPFSSLDPRLTVRDILAEPIVNFGLASGARDVDGQVVDLLAKVRLSADTMRRFPHEFSGGQRQRICIARALAPGASLIVCDEAVSALDVSVKAQIINLLSDLKDDLGLALLFISHDLAVVEHLTDRVAVMYLGRIVELGGRESIFGAPRHPYTQALLSAVPTPDPDAERQRIILKGEIPSALDPPKGCRFHTRCPFAFDRCRAEEPKLRHTVTEEHLVACHLDEVPVPARTAKKRSLS
jgi:peptide/nickel transport system ATP-binding protein